MDLAVLLRTDFRAITNDLCITLARGSTICFTGWKLRKSSTRQCRATPPATRNDFDERCIETSP